MTDTTTADATPAPEPAPPARRGRALVVLAVVALVVAVAAAALALGRSGEVDDLRAERNELRDERDDRQAVARVAAAFGEAYLTFDYEDADATADAIAEYVTDAFASAFADRREPLRDSYEALQTSTIATADEVFVGDVDGDRARALVILDVDLSSAAIGQQELVGFSIVVDLVKEDGEWLVDRQRFAPQPDITGGAPAPPAP